MKNRRVGEVREEDVKGSMEAEDGMQRPFKAATERRES